MTFCSIFMVDSSFFSPWCEVNNYGKIIFILCLFSTKMDRTYKSHFLGQNFAGFTTYFFEKIIFLNLPTSKSFLWKKAEVYRYPVEKIWVMLLYPFIPIFSIFVTWGCFLGLFWPSRAKKEQKKCKQTNYWPSKIFSKKLHTVGLYFRKKISVLRQLVAELHSFTFWVFFVPSR